MEQLMARLEDEDTCGWERVLLRRQIEALQQQQQQQVLLQQQCAMMGSYNPHCLAPQQAAVLQPLQTHGDGLIRPPPAKRQKPGAY
jgi:hypothetical protein